MRGLAWSTCVAGTRIMKRQSHSGVRHGRSSQDKLRTAGLAALFLACDAYSLVLPERALWISDALFVVSMTVLLTIGLPVVARLRLNKAAAATAVGLAFFLLAGSVFGHKGVSDFDSYRYVCFTVFIVLAASLFASAGRQNARSVSWGLGISILIQIAILLWTVVDTRGAGEASPSDSIAMIDYADNAVLADMYLSTSRILGYGAILAACLYHRTKSWAMLATSVGCLLVALFGGGRGEALAAFLVVLWVLPWRRVALVLIPALGCALAIPWVSETITRAATVRRLGLGLESIDFAYRDFLLGQAWHLATLSPQNFLLGTGTNGFQRYYGYEFGMYPHNVLAEALTTAGLGFALLLAIVLVRLGVRFVRFSRAPGWERVFPAAIGCYVALIALKSGSLWTNWLMFASLVLVGAMRGTTIPGSRSQGRRGRRRNRI